MTAPLDGLVAQVEQAREQYLVSVGGLTTLQGNFRSLAGTWSMAEVTEHLVHAEQGGVLSIWKAAMAVRTGEPVWGESSPHRGLSIEEVIERTWQPREKVPEGAAPRLGGPLGYWVANLSSCQTLLPSLGTALEGLDLSVVISGPLDARQRLEFLRFHLNRHRGQVETIKHHPAFPDECSGHSDSGATATT